MDAWGQMGSLWGLNTSMARVHALLIVSEDPLSLDAIAHRLQISRGNASMCLKELRNWGVVRRVKVRGDRRDYYLTEPEVWKMFFAIARERKRRELDPVLAALRELLGTLPQGASGQAVKRLKEMKDLLATLDAVASQVLAQEENARSALAFLAGGATRKKT